MPANDSFEYDYTPGYTKPTHEYGQPYGDEFHAEAVEELLLSVSAGYTQRGVTLAGGQGVLPTGCILARHTASGKYFQYLSTASDGRAVPVGILRDGRDTGGTGYATAGTYNTAYAAAYPNVPITLTQTSGNPTFAASPAGKPVTDCQANLVYKGVLNANLISGTDTSSLVTTGPQGVTASTLTSLGARVVGFGGGTGVFPGGPMDGNPSGETAAGVNAFIF